MADPRKPVQGALKAIQTASKAADEQLAAGKLKAALEAQQAPMTRPQGTGLPLMPRDQGMYTPREQKDLPRMPTVDKARAANKSPKYNERTQDLLDSRKARGKVDDLINKGKALDVKEWYGTEPLRQVAMDAGRTPEQFESLMAQLASASQRNPVDKQNQMGSYLYHLSETGQLPENSLLLTNKLKKALKEDPSLAEGRTLIELPTGYGSLAQGDIFNRALMISQGKIGEALPPNKKLGTFYENLLGNLQPVTVDVNALRGPIIEQGDPRWLASKLVEKDDKGKVINSYKPREMFDTGEMTMREAKQRPGFWEAAPKGSEYAGFEELWQRGAKRHNIEPAEAQALGWYGSADVTALKTKPENYVDNLERLIKRTAEQTGKSPTEVMNDMVTGKGFLRKEGGAVNSKESPEDMARFQKRFAMHKAMGGSVKKMAGGGRASIFDKPVHMVDGGKITKGVMGAVNKASKMADEKIAADAMKKAAESAGMKAPVTANKPLTTVQDFYTSFGDSVRKRAADMQATMDSLNYKYDKGQRVFTEDSARKNWPPMTVLGRVLEGNRIMREDPTDFLSKKIIDEATGKAKRTPHEPGYKVRLEHSPDNWSEFVIPESAIKGNVDMANGGAMRMPAKKTQSFIEGTTDGKSLKDRLRQAAPLSPIGIGLNAGYAGYKYLTGEDPLEDLRRKLDTKINPDIDTGSESDQEFEKLEKARGGLTRMAEGGESIDKSLKRMQGYSVLDQKDPSKVLSGNIMAGASWNSINPTLADRLTEATGKPTYNAAVGATTSADTYKQLMDFIEAGGSFEQGSNVFLQAGGADFLKGVPRKETQENLDKILTELENQGVNVVLTGSPNASSYEQVISNNFDPASDPIYNDVVSKHSNVVLVDSMGEILQDKSLLSDSIHPNEQGWEVYNDSVLGALNQLNQRNEAVENTNTVDEIETVVENQDTPVEIPQQITQTYKPEEQYTQEAVSQDLATTFDQQAADPIKQDFQEVISQGSNNVVDQQVTDPIKQEFQEAITQEPVQTQQVVDLQPPPPPEVAEVAVPSGPDYSRAYSRLGGADVVNRIRNDALGAGLSEEFIESVFSQYYEPEFAPAVYKRGGAVRKESPADMARFQKRFAMHKAIGGKVSKPQKFDGGGIASPEESSGPPPDRETKAGLMAEYLAKAAKEQGKEELSSLKKPRALTDLLNRGVLANNPLSAGVDLFNMGLNVVGAGSEKPFLGSEHLKELMNKTGVTSGEERPMMETALSFASPTAMIKGAMKATDAAKKAPEFLNKASNAISSSKLSPLATEAKTASAGKPTGATYATKQEGPFFRVSPTTLDTSKAKTRGIREADELQSPAPLGGGAGSTGRETPQLLSSEEVGRIIADPVANEPLNIAKKYTQETQGTDFVFPDIPESSLVKQSAIGRTQQLAVDGSPEYKTAVFDAYAQQMPEVLEKAGAKNYDDLMEKAYRQLAKETDDQFKALPYNFSYHRAGEGNYNGAMDMASDVHGNKHLYVYQGGDKHDFLNRVDPASGLNENEKFRAVHDLLGHAIYGNQFGPKGEEMAWAIHSQMYSPLARLAMTAETRGQNSMVNYSPLNANLKAELAMYDSMANEARRKGDKALLNEIIAAKRQAYSGFEFAPNKAVLLPPEFLSPKYTGGMPSYLEAANRPVKGTETQSVLTHFSNDPNLQMLDPKRYGTGIKGAEAERLRDYAGGVKDRSYFYLGEPGTVAPEAGLGVNRYRGEASSLYDITQDPLNFQRLARESNRTPFTAKYNQGMTYPLQDANDVERLVKEYGYQGMANPKATKPMAIMFKETPVRRQARGGLTLMK